VITELWLTARNVISSGSAVKQRGRRASLKLLFPVCGIILDVSHLIFWKRHGNCALQKMSALILILTAIFKLGFIASKK
jgi:hypothetical protein